MGFGRLDTAAMSRALARIADRPGDIAEIFCERRAEAEWPADEAPCGVRLRREAGLAVRLLRRGPENRADPGRPRGWIASRDGLSGADLQAALYQVARTQPAALAVPELETGPEPAAPIVALKSFGAELERALRRQHVAFPLRLQTRWSRRDLQVVGPRFVPPAEREAFFSFDVELPWGRAGGLATELGAGEAERLAAALAARFRARDAPPPPAGRRPCWFAPAATAVVLHEAIAHSLEADLLALSGSPEAAIGLMLAPAGVDVLDDPRRAPHGVERTTDDEGQPVARRWLLRDGRVDQPLADLAAAMASDRLLAGAGFRGARDEPPLPRVHHVELLAGTARPAALAAAAAGGLFVPEIDAGRLDPASGAFDLYAPWGRLVERDEPGSLVGPFRLRGRVADLLQRFALVGDDPRATGAGWCAKSGRRRAVWATAPSLVVDGLEVVA